MEALLAAGVMTTGAAFAAYLQARSVQRQSRVLQAQWDVAPPAWLPNLRRDAAHGTPAPAMQRQRSSVRSSVASTAGGADSSAFEFKFEIGHDVSEEFHEWAAEALPEDREESECDERRENANLAEPVESLTFAPFLLDALNGRVWLGLVGGMMLVSLLAALMAHWPAHVGLLAIAVTTVGTATLFPLPWAWAALAVGLLHGANLLSHYLSGGRLVAGDLDFCLGVYVANALLVSLVAAISMQRLRQMIVMTTE